MNKFSILFSYTKTGAPVFVKVPEPLEPIKKEESAKFECIIEAVPKATVLWLINGKEVTNKDGVQIEKDPANNRYSLLIPKANPVSHHGVISVKATNPIGTAQHDVNLNILGIIF